MAPGYSRRDVEILRVWLDSDEVKDYITACDERNGNYAFHKARCRQQFAKLFYDNIRESGELKYPGALWIMAIIGRILAAFLRKSALEIITSSSDWNGAYWLGELISLFSMGLQLVIAYNSRWSTTATRTMILVCTFISHLTDSIFACYLGSREDKAFFNGISYVSRIGSELVITIIGCWGMIRTTQPQEVDKAEYLNRWIKLPVDYKYWAESSLANHRDETIFQKLPRRGRGPIIQTLPRALPPLAH
ncbi:hypothetical protein MGYG_08286 [Nannizzia gypsea CBS 118893]|uniref:Uncharacterized protein n=1 Tax=Arthroderma gypseum (strain ATCC MYA-4604 / CBS 118893) TaxID=535722 RepID=E4V692_ARTGP|nr:hypothetical protein MGYG_08286 [Nannizzia gypsea CBS 118893]EFR05275.1 hypothetical protein MGYG_08286 [Nannizzia gypsea CBS 118893]